ncbi:DUF1176 domain-containing protein [Sphingomonas silueang]|uniref:DUF1176 domain-containing protein n=1 Tax=Sphingomonas silueang TaxID=3156617 RepID=UPI0032B44025
MRAPLSLFLALPLLACSGADDPAGNAAEPAAHRSPAASLPTGDSHTVPQPTALRTFGDWTAGCDNGGTCQANALLGEDDPAPPVLVAIERAAGPDGAITLRLQREGTTALPLTLAVDGEAVARGGKAAGEFVALTGEPAATLARRIAAGKRLGVADGTGEAIGSISLTGAAAALRWIDAQQGRADTVGAIVARGKRPDTRPAPALPVVQAPVIRGEAALLDPQLVTTMRATAGCGGEQLPEVTTRPLGGGRTLALVPCVLGAYNLVSAVFVVERGKATPAQFDAPSGIAPGDVEMAAGVADVVNGDFADGVLTSDAKGRGLGDCGVAQRFAWDGARFRLIEQREMTECRGSIDYIRTWAARVVR